MSFSSTTAELIRQSGLSDSTLYRLRKEGVLRPGRDYRANGYGTKQPRLVWDPEAVDKTLTLRSKRVLA